MYTRPVRIALAAAVAALHLVALAGPALGHASLVTSEPAEGSAHSVSQLTQITLTFDDDLDAATSQFVIADTSGATAATGHVATDPKVMHVTGLVLAWGAYEARWTAVAPDGDLTRGVVHFTVIQDGGVSQRPLVPTSGGSDSTSPIVAIVAALAVVALGAWAFSRRNREMKA